MSNVGIVWIGLYSVKKIRQYPNNIFVFGDNVLGKGYGGQACIRDETNAFGIPTKLYPNMDENSFFFDDMVNVSDIIFDRIDKLAEKCAVLNYIATFPSAGLGTGRAELPTRAPELYADMCDYIYELFKVDIFYPEIETP